MREDGMAEREPPDTVIHIDGVKTQFGDQVIHENLSLDVRRGEVLGVVGGSGTGKSVLLREIVGLQRPTAGRIDLLGEEVWALKPLERQALNTRTGVLFQDGALFSSLTVAENIQVGMREHLDLSPGLMDELAALKVAAMLTMGT
jgi:phospholipid/cholesterol/gamma-HCH transport system ATP-binding protein